MKIFTIFRCIIAILALAIIPASNAMAVNYLVFNWATAPGVMPAFPPLTVTASIQPSCPVGGVVLYYGMAEGERTIVGAPSPTTGYVCLKGVPNTVKLTANENFSIAPTLTLNGTYQALTTDHTSYSGNNFNSVGISFPDDTYLLFTSYTAGGGYGYVFRSKIFQAGSVPGGAYTVTNGIWSFGNIHTSLYLMGY